MTTQAGRHARLSAATRPAARPWRSAVLSAMLLAASALATAQTAARLPAVVVWDFDNQTAPALSAVPRERTAWLQRALSEHFTAALLRVPGLRVVERLRLQALLAEQQVATSALADDDSRVKLGRVIGAERMVFGGFFVVGDAVQVHLRLVDTASGKVLLSEETTAPFDAVMQQLAPLERRLNRGLGAGAAPTAAATATVVVTEWPGDLWQAHDQALALADAGQWDAALDALRALLQRRPDFTPAERQVAAVLDRMARR